MTDRLQGEALKRGIEMYRQTYDDIHELIKDYPNAKAFFNCTGLGSYSLKGVKDKLLYPTRVCLLSPPNVEFFVDKKQGQVLLVENPKMAVTKMYEQGGQVMSSGTPLKRMYFRSPQRVNKDTTYVFPRLPGGGVILGGCRFDNEWSGDVDLEFAEDIKRRCCALAPELGRPEDLKVIQHGVGLRRRFPFYDP